MGFFNLKWFELEKKSDGLYRCKGGHLADIIFLTCGIFYCLGLAILQPFKRLFQIVFGWIQTLIFVLHDRK